MRVSQGLAATQSAYNRAFQIQEQSERHQLARILPKAGNARPSCFLDYQRLQASPLEKPYPVLKKGVTRLTSSSQPVVWSKRKQ